MADKKTPKTTKKTTDPRVKLAELQQELLDAKKSHKAGELLNPRRLRELRREIARALTELNTNEKKEA